MSAESPPSSAAAPARPGREACRKASPGWGRGAGSWPCRRRSPAHKSSTRAGRAGGGRRPSGCCDPVGLTAAARRTSAGPLRRRACRYRTWAVGDSPVVPDEPENTWFVYLLRPQFQDARDLRGHKTARPQTDPRDAQGRCQPAGHGPPPCWVERDFPPTASGVPTRKGGGRFSRTVLAGPAETLPPAGVFRLVGNSCAFPSAKRGHFFGEDRAMKTGRRVALVLGLAAVLTPSAAADAPADWTISRPFTYQNLAVYLIRGKDVLPGKKFLPLQEPLAEKKPRPRNRQRQRTGGGGRRGGRRGLHPGRRHRQGRPAGPRPGLRPDCARSIGQGAPWPSSASRPVAGRGGANENAQQFNASTGQPGKACDSPSVPPASKDRSGKRSRNSK